MTDLEHNNRERLKALGAVPTKDMTKRERIALDTLTSLIEVMKPSTDEGFDVCIERAITLTDKLIKKLND